MKPQGSSGLGVFFKEAFGGGVSAATLLLIVLAGALVFVWPLAHVIGLRNTLLVGIFLWLAIDLVRKPELRKVPQGSGAIIMVLALFVLWLLVVAFFVDENPRHSFGEIKSQWLPACIAFAVGLMLPMNLCARSLTLRACLRFLVYVLVGLSALQVAVGAWFLVRAGALPEGFFDPFSAHKSYLTYVTAIAASFLIADLVPPEKLRPLRLGGLALWVGLGIVVVATFFSGARNGIITILLMGLLGSFFWIRKVWHPSGRAFWPSVLAGSAIFAVAIFFMFKSDVRWARFTATVPVAWNIDANHAWVNAEITPLPLGTDGLPVERTAYERISWARAAVRLLYQHPLGVGVTRNAFKELVQKTYGNPHAAHSHNGYLDLGLSIGIPGLALWILFCAIVILRGLKTGIGLNLGTGVALLLLVVGHCVRTGLDSTLRDHILSEFMFFVGILLAASSIEESTSIASEVR